MDNYKIKVKDEAESKEAQELFFELGFQHRWDGAVLKESWSTARLIYAENGILWAGNCSDDFHECEFQELTLPQLRDLVVLKRNDVKDATHEDQYGDKWLYLDERHYVYLNYQWGLPTGEFLERYELKPIEKSQPQDPALISGDVALANVHNHIVQYLHDDEPYGRWTTITDNLWSQYHLGMFLDPDTKFKFRFKPQTIKLELELPKPFEPKEGEVYYYLKPSNAWGFGCGEWGDDSMQNEYIQYGAWPTKEDVVKVVEQLRKIRGTNS